MDFDDEDPWGEEPAWAREDMEDGESDEGPSQSADGLGGFGAHHILVLIDCRPSMFNPCIPLVQEEEEENTKSEGEESVMISAFDAALIACEKLLRLRVHHVATSKTGKRDGVGILLYGTKQRPIAEADTTTEAAETGKKDESDNEESDNNESDEEEEDHDEEDSASPLSSTHTLLDITPPGIQQIRSLRDCLPDRDRGLPRKRDLEEEYGDTNKEAQPSNVAQSMGHKTLCPLRSALYEAGKAFLGAKCVRKSATTSKTPADSKTIWVFTNHDNPCDGNRDEEKLVLVVAKDVKENGVTMQVWPLPRADGVAFSRELFYDKIVAAPASDSEEPWTFDLEEMLENVSRQWKKVRRVAAVPLLLPDWRDRLDDPGIMVDLFGIVQVQKKPQSVTIHQLTNKMTEKVTQVIDKVTGEIVSDSRSKKAGTVDTSSVDRIRTFAKFGDDLVPLSADELATIKKQSSAADKASLILLGFKPMDSLSTMHRIDRSFLVYPNDDVVKGSKAAFANLHAAMVEKRVAAIGELLQRVGTTSRLVALYPQQEEHEVVGSSEGTSDRQVTPPGIVLVQLPFEDDVRAVDVDLGAAPSDEPGRETDPKAAKEKSALDAATDLVRSQNLDGIEFGYSYDNAALSRFWGYIESVAIDTTLKSEHDETEVEYATVKDVAGEQIEALRCLLPEDVVATKSLKRKRGVNDECDWLELYKTNSLSECTVPLLKKYLKENDLKLSGKKDDLIERVCSHLEELSKNDQNGKSRKAGEFE